MPDLSYDVDNMYTEPKPMSAHEKAAILFIALGGDYAAKVFPHMDEDEIETITLDIANNKQVSVEKKNTVISEFYQLMMAQSNLRKMLWKRHWARKEPPKFSKNSAIPCRCARSSSCARQTRLSF